MKTMFVLISPPMTDNQRTDAVERFGVEGFLFLDTSAWSKIPADAESVLPYIEGSEKSLREAAKPGDILFVQGDFGATFAMVQFAYRLGMIPVYATTERLAKEQVKGNDVITTRIFNHVRFRMYERID
jgi:hypothetical protein